MILYSFMKSQNGSTNLQNTILKKFLRSYNIFHLYDFCYRHYKKNMPGIQQKYANLFSYIHLMNTRSVQQDKEEQFIRDWRKIVQDRKRINFTAHLQELIKLLEIIDEHIKQARLFIQFLNDITLARWERLENAILAELAEFRRKIEQIFRSILSKQEGKINSQLKKRLKFIIDLAVDPAMVKTEPSQAKGKENAHQAVNFRQPEQHRKNTEQNSAYKVASMKLCIKQRPQAVKLLTNEQVQSLRKEIAERLKSSTIIAEASVKGSDNTTSFKIKSQNYNTYHTEISEDSQESSSREEGNINSNLLEKKNGKISLPRHHRSNFEDASKLKKLLDPKDQNPKFSSIHKIEGINGNPKFNRNIDDIPSRYTIQDSSVNRFVSSDIHTSNIDSSNKKPRVGKISIMGKLDRTIKKIQIKKRPRGGMFIHDQKLKEINEIYKDVKQDESSNGERSSRSNRSALNSSSTTSEQGERGEKDSEKLSALDNKRISELIESYSHKEQNKYKRRFGVSSKKLNSNKSIDWSSQQAKRLDKNKMSDVSRTSFFRSSGSNLQEKRILPKSKYNNTDSHKKVKQNKSQMQFYQERESREYQDMAKWALSKKSNQRLITEQNIFNIDRQSVVSELQKFKALNDIHDREKLDRSSKYEEYYDEILRRKYEGGTRDWNRHDFDQAPTFFKIDNYVDKKSSKLRSSEKQQLLFDLMLSNIKTIQNLQLQQIGVENTEQ